MINLKNTQPTTSNKNQFSLTSVLPLGIMLLFSMTPVFAQVSRRPSPTMQTPPSTTPVTSAKTQPAETAHKFTTAEIRAKLLGKSSLTMGQRVINPHVNATLSALAQQMKTAQAERSSMQASSPQTININKNSPSMANRGGPPIVEAARASSRASVNPAVETSVANQGVQAHQNDCAAGKTILMTVNGKIDGTIFTPDPNYNLYTIKGCNFGMQQGQLHLYGTFMSGQVQLLVNFWSDTSIVATMDSNLSGELDQNNVHLVMALANGQQLDRGGEQFYAARDIKTLTTIPANWITYGRVIDASGATVPPLSQATPPSIGVSRLSGDRFSGGQDYFDFSRLKPGFTTYSFQFGYYPITCNDDVAQTTLYNDATFQPQWDGDNIRIVLGAQTCHYSAYILIPAYDLASSSYVLTVQVSGPRGIDPIAQ